MQQIKKKNSKIFGERVKQLRLKICSSMNEFVLSRGGVSVATWSRIESGKCDFKFSTIILAASMLGITVSELTKDLPLDYSIIE